MNTRQSYNLWASQYDTNVNKTRDLEAIALRECLKGIPFRTCLEIGCGTGKNTEWLIKNAEHITAVDLSEEMLAKAKSRVNFEGVDFIQADITQPWQFGKEAFDLVSFSLVLEHIQNLNHIFNETSKSLRAGGYVYVGELHPFKQYSGSKARFETESGTHVVECYNHHISEFVQTGKKNGLQLIDLNEYFDADDSAGLPRILTLVLRKG
jgi:ubiquinone/menaquinone biosynthesis C-methylase UbiE